ncbi:hypothetical protein Acr_00g0037060 [Actinidia rufa]|uniref:Wall-associated receptor kinase domain-containing protein n=1 Tax=Actinidia rufa TaxID=165716 RepID=A0A7J0DGV5_9ERIC|nr:hypothetical protein Acr_00g0037060 [Actinidia rufa]
MTMSLSLMFLQLLLATVDAVSQALPGCEINVGTLASHTHLGQDQDASKTATFLLLVSRGRKYNTGCLSLCDSIDNVNNGSCSGIGCCQAIIPKEVRSFSISANSYNNHRSVLDFNPCRYAFVAEDNTCNFSSLDLANFQKRETVPVVLD